MTDVTARPTTSVQLLTIGHTHPHFATIMGRAAGEIERLRRERNALAVVVACLSFKEDEDESQVHALLSAVKRVEFLAATLGVVEADPDFAKYLDIPSDFGGDITP